MTRAIFQSACVAFLFLFAAESVRAESTIYWGNSDNLSGEFISADNRELVWQSKLFNDDFHIRYDAIRSVAFGGSDSTTPPSGDVRIRLRDFSTLFGTLIAIDDSTVDLKTSDDLTLKIRRELVIEIYAINPETLAYIGPTSIDEWDLLKSRRGAKGTWALTTGNFIKTSRWGSVFHKFDPGDQATYEVEMFSSQRPQFVIAFHKDPAKGPRIETWDDEVVLVFGDDFESLDTLTPESRRLRYRIQIDHESRTTSVFRANGEELGSITMSEGTNKDRGFYLRNKGYDLQLRHLHVRKGLGKTGGAVDEGETRLRKIDGAFLTGELDRYRANSGFRIDGKTVPMDQLDSIVLRWSGDKPYQRPLPKDTNAARASWHNGDCIVGRIMSADGDSMVFSTSWSAEKFTVPKAGMHKLAFPNVALANNDDIPDRFTYSNVTLRGHIEGGEVPLGDWGSAAIRWRPYGAKNASTLATNAPATFTSRFREAYLTSEEDESNISRDRLFLENNDVVSASVESLDSDLATFTLPFSDATTLEAEHLRAIELARTTSDDEALADGGWRQLSKDRETVEMGEDGKLVLKPNGVFGHPNLLLGGDELTFRLSCTEHSGFVSASLFADQLSDDDESPVALISFYFNGNRLYLQAQRGRGGGMNFNQQVPLKEQGVADVRFVFSDAKKVTVFVNDVQATDATLRDGDRAGNGIIFANSASGPFTQMNSDITISDVALKRSRGVLASQQVDAEAKEQALIVPRFRRDGPSTHALIARNGDLLRGRFQSLERDEISFISRLDDFTFPRERIGAIIWLDPPVEGDEERPESSEKAALAPVIAIFDDGSRIGLRPTKMTETHLFGVSERFGDCKIARAGLRELRVNHRTDPGQIPYQDWQLTMAPEPVLPGGGEGGSASPLVGKEAPKLKLARLDDDSAVFNLGDHDGKVVVLDFWATWCGPCIRAMPDYLAVMEAFDETEAIFIGVNQGEAAEVVSEFLVRREWFDFTVVMDGNQTAGAAFGVEAIPHTVVVGPDGNVAWVHTGYRPEAATEMKEVILKLLNP